ncbi:MAG: hypothetical protein ISF22_09800 [Methanomassiliicoccus sp.]|nr:hypothetical protein [Methanomassiliicoccus sp.]
MKRSLLPLLSLAVIYLAVSSIILVPGPDGNGMDLSARVEADGTLIMDYSVEGGAYERNVTAIALEVNRMHQGPIYVLINDNLEFPVRVSLHRLADHFNNEFSLLGSDLRATVINTDGLPRVFSNYQATLICGPGADLPDYVAFPAQQWLERGGLWVGIGSGSVPFIYSTDNGERPNATMKLEFVAMDFDSGEGMSSSPMAEALALRYVAPDHPFLLNDLKTLGGTSIGYEFVRGERLATAGIVPLGRGSLLVLAGNMTAPPLASGEEVLAWDLERMLLLNVPWWSGNMRFESDWTTGAGITGSLELPLTGSDYVSCGLFSNSDAYHAVRVERFAVASLPGGSTA